MRRLKIIEHISLDGVIQMTAGPGDDFPYGDWTAPYRSPAGLLIVDELYGKTCDVLFGRRTYDLMARFWPNAPKSPMADRLNAATKYVVTRTLERLAWKTSKRLSGVDEIRKLKASEGPELHLWGSSALLQALIAEDLVDEYRLWIAPVVLGGGKRLFENGVPPLRLTLGATRSTPSGVLLNTYRPAGRLP